MTRALAVLGTGTDVGKTAVAAALGLALRRRGRRCGYFKPVATGASRRDGRLVAGDARRVRAALGLGIPARDLSAVCYRQPLAPWVAARSEGGRFSLARVRTGWRRAAAGMELVLVEGIGGPLVPITRRLAVADLCARMGWPACLVGAAGLGTINHTLLAVEALRRRRVAVKGIVLNGATGRDASEAGNSRAIARLTGIPVVAVLPRVRGLWRSPAALLRLARGFTPRALRTLTGP